MTKIVLLILSLIFITLPGCSESVENIPEGSDEEADAINIGSAKEAISLKDFDVTYNSFVLNSRTPLNDIAENLSLEMGKRNEYTEYKASGYIDGVNNTWFVLHCPNAESEELTIEYICDEETLNGYIVRMNLKKAATDRGAAVGDRVEKVRSLYGEDTEPIYNSENSKFYKYKVDNYSLDIVYNTETDTVTQIDIDFDTNAVMENMDIPAFD
jgi:hypothetical protein